jgi:hypothetical protein
MTLDKDTALTDLRRIAAWLAQDTDNDEAQGAAADLLAVAGSFAPQERQYAVLVNVGTEWPDVVFVGSWEDAVELDRSLDDTDAHTEITAVVAPDEALAWKEDA